MRPRRSMMGKILAIGLTLSALAFIPSTAEAVQTDFYVAGGGVDSGTCPSTAPCATITRATQQALGSSNTTCSAQTVHIGSGGWNESVSVTAHCNTLTFSGAGQTATTWNGDGVNCGTLIVNTGANVLITNMTMEAAGA